MNLSSATLRDHFLQEIEKESKANVKCRMRNEDVSIKLDLFGVERSAKGEVAMSLVDGTLRRDAPRKVEVRPHVKEGERKSEEEGFEEVAGLPISSPIFHLLPYLLQLNALLCIGHLKRLCKRTQFKIFENLLFIV